MTIYVLTLLHPQSAGYWQGMVSHEKKDKLPNMRQPSRCFHKSLLCLQPQSDCMGKWNRNRATRLHQKTWIRLTLQPTSGEGRVNAIVAMSGDGIMATDVTTDTVNEDQFFYSCNTFTSFDGMSSHSLSWIIVQSLKLRMSFNRLGLFSPYSPNLNPNLAM